MNDTIEKLERLANDKGATPGEKAAAKAAIEKKKASRPGLEPEYKVLIEEGKKAVKDEEDAQWKLGELASKVNTKYGESRLPLFAEDIGIPYNTMKVYRTTYLSWCKQNHQLGTRVPFSVARAMISVPEDVRAREIKKNPNMKAREAGAIAKRFSDKRPRSAKSASKRAEKGEKSQSNTAKEHQFTEIIHHYMDHDTIKLLKSINTSGAAGDRVLAALKGLRNQIDKEIKRIEDSRKIGGVK